MNCAEVQRWLHAYADGELDVVRGAEVDEHIKTCAACAGEISNLRLMRATLQNSGLAHRAPDALRKKCGNSRAKLRHRGKTTCNGSGNGWRLARRRSAALAIVLRPAGISPRDELLNEAVASHVRSLMANHLTDVASSDQHTVKPWFDGKLDFAPQVKDFAEQGFPLVGGRLDYLDGRAVAALVYRHEKHLINVFVWPAANTERGTEQIENVRGYNVVTCDVGGFHYCLVSDVEEKQLHQLAGLFEK